MTGEAPAELVQYIDGSEVATHGLDVIMLFHYSDSDSDKLKSAKSRFRRLIRNFMVTGEVSGWESLPAVYDVRADKDIQTDKWTEQYCREWRSFYPMYSWMN